MLSLERKNILKNEISKAIEAFDTERLPGDSCFTEKDIYDVLYNFATEDMRGYYKEFGKIKRFLTVGASGDQILNAIKAGAEKIDVFDLNRLAKRQCAQKVAAAQVLDYEELYKYFISFKEEMFKCFNGKLALEDNVFWESLYDFKGEEEIHNLYPYRRFDKEMIYQINPYLDKEGYEEFQQRIADVEINYYDVDLYSLNRCLADNTYDAMTFSNIYEYLNYGRFVGKENALRYYKFIMEEMYPRLVEDGTIMVTYMYAFSDKVKEYIDEVKNNGELEKMVLSGNISLDQLDLYLRGLTSQNYSYSLLLDLFEKENIKKVATSHIVYGQSFDTSHDMALCLKK